MRKPDLSAGVAVIAGFPLMVASQALLSSSYAGGRPAGVVLGLVAVALARRAARRHD